MIRAAGLALLAICPGCGVMSVSHMMGEQTCSPVHPWHAIPFYVVCTPVALVVDLVMTPAMLVEYGMTGKYPIFGSETGVTAYPGIWLGTGAGYLAALPFFVVGFPAEIAYQSGPDGKQRTETPEQHEKQQGSQAPEHGDGIRAAGGS
jgi:hypothetical protein